MLIDQRRHLGLAYATLALATIAFALAMGVVWRDWEESGGEALWRTLAAFAAFAGASAQAATTTARLRPDDTPLVRRLYVASLVLGVLLAGMIALAAALEIDSSGYYRVLGAVAVADVLLVVVQSVGRRLARPARATAAAGTGEAALLVTGPREALEAAIPGLERRGLRVSRPAS